MGVGGLLLRRKGSRSLALALVATIAFVTLAFFLLSGRGGGEEAPRIGAQAPDFELASLDGGTVKLSNFRGKGVMINFWATWCGPCRFEMPTMDKIYREQKDKGFVILAVNLQEDGATAKRFVDEFQLTFPTLLEIKGTVAQQYGLIGLPTSYFVGRDGVIKDINVGAMDTELLTSKIRKIL